MNCIQLLGRLTADPELKHTSGGKNVCSFDLAVKRKYSKDTTDFIPCVAWEKTAETISKYFHKGQIIVVSGSLLTRKYEDKNGYNRTAYEVNVSDFYFAESKSNNTNVNIDVANDPLKQLSERIENMDFIDNDNIGDDDLPF